MTPNNDRYRQQQNTQVEREGLVAQVVHVIIQLHGEVLRDCAPIRSPAPPVYLPPAGDARDDQMAGVVERAVVRDKLGQLRPRTNKGHFAEQDVEELW
jgi:hypothetical protein